MRICDRGVTWLLAVGMTLMLLIMLTGCAADHATDVEPEASSEQSVTEISWWTFPILAQEHESDALGSYEQRLIDAFEAENQDVKVKLELLDYKTGPEQLEQAFLTGEACDVLLDAPGRIIAYGNAGRLAPLNDLFVEELVRDVDNLELLGACMSGDTMYMYPLSSAPFYMAFNRSMLEQAGVAELVREGWTTEDFDQVIRALHREGFVPGAVFCRDTGGDQGTRAFVANLYDSHVTDNAVTTYTLGDAQGVQALSYIKDCVDEGLLLNGTLLNGTDAIENFVYGRASFSILWGSSQQRTYQNLMDTFGVETVEVPLPSADGVAELEYLVNGFCVMDNGDAAKIDAAKRLIQFACDDAVWGPKNVVQTGCIPVRTSFGELYADEARMQTIEGWTAYYVPYYNTVDGFAKMRVHWYQALRDLFNGYATPEEAMAVFEEQANRSLASTEDA